jgi:transposase
MLEDAKRPPVDDLPVVRRKGKGKLSEEQEQEVIRFYKEGMSSTDIALQFGVSASPILGILRRHGVPRRDCVNSRLARYGKVFTEEQQQEAVNLYLNGVSSPELSIRFGVKYSSILAALRRRGIEPRDNSAAQRKHTLCEDVFSIRCPESLVSTRTPIDLDAR